MIDWLWGSKATIVLFVGLHFQEFRSAAIGKNNKNKNWTYAQSIENKHNIGSIICTNDSYSKNVVNLSPKAQIMCI